MCPDHPTSCGTRAGQRAPIVISPVRAPPLLADSGQILPSEKPLQRPARPEVVAEFDASVEQALAAAVERPTILLNLNPAETGGLAGQIVRSGGKDGPIELVDLPANHWPLESANLSRRLPDISTWGLRAGRAAALLGLANLGVNLYPDLTRDPAEVLPERDAAVEERVQESQRDAVEAFMERWRAEPPTESHDVREPVSMSALRR